MFLQRPGAVGLRMGINGVWGNMGIAVAPLITGVLLLFGRLEANIFCPWNNLYYLWYYFLSKYLL